MLSVFILQSQLTFSGFAFVQVQEHPEDAGHIYPDNVGKLPVSTVCPTLPGRST